MAYSKVFDTHKGRRMDTKRTICEVLRLTYDKCVCGLQGVNDVLLAELIPLLEEAFIDGIKMNRKLCEYKFNTMELFPDDNNTEEAKKTRAERVRLQNLIEDNEKVLKKYEAGNNIRT